VRELQVSAAVAELVGEQNLRLLAEQAQAGGYTCTVCEQRAASLAEHPASVLVVRDGTVTAVKLSHVACESSRVVDAPPGALRVAAETPATAVAGILPSAAEFGMRPALLVEMADTVDVAGGGERVDGVITHVVERGLHLVARIGTTPPAVAGWAVTLSGRDGVQVTSPDTLVYDGSAWRPDGWERLVDALGGRCELYIGVGLRLAAGLPGGAEGLRRLRDASRAGLLAGGSVGVRLAG
jgi:hypothetical protein